MALQDFFKEIDDAVKTVLDSSFKIEVSDTKTVPHFDDPFLTYDNFDGKIKKCKRLESCVLYVDIRNSAAISTETHAAGLARLYSVFVRSMIKAGKHYGGHVRNIIGDRVMVIFDQENCFKNAVNTAVLMNSISQYIINKRYGGDFKCGIGIDYGKMLVTKVGEIRRGDQKEFYRSFVWLGRPANVASRLTDLANKTLYDVDKVVRVGYHYPAIDEWHWLEKSYDWFIDQLETSFSPVLTFKDEYFRTFRKDTNLTSTSYQPILITESVLKGFKLQCPQDKISTNNFFSEQKVSIKEFSGKVYGGDIYFPGVKDV